MRIRGIALVVMAWLPVSGSAGEDPIALQVRPSACVEPCNVQLSVRVMPDAANREVTISADSEDFYSSSTREIDEESMSFHSILLRELPQGRYEVRVTVERAPLEDAHRVTHFRVVGTEDELEEVNDALGVG